MNLFTIVAKTFWHRKLRSLLTILGVGVSIAAFITLVGLSRNLTKTFQKTYQTRGTDLIAIEKGTVDILSSSIDASYTEKVRGLADIEDVNEVLLDFYVYKFKEYVLLYGWDVSSCLFDDLQIVGSRIRNTDEAIIGSLAAKRLNKKIGDTIKIKNASLLIVGVFRSKSLLEDGAIIMALPKLQAARNVSGKVSMLNIRIKPSTTEASGGGGLQKDIDLMQKKISNAFPELEIRNVQSFIANNTPLFMILNFTWAISVVAFIIVLLGIMNTTTTSVLERTKEIGILRAIGWSNQRIVRLIVYEAAGFGFLGGVAGIIMGNALMAVLVATPQLRGFMSMSFDFEFMGLALGISIALGVISGLYPGMRALGIEPIKVLRYE